MNLFNFYHKVASIIKKLKFFKYGTQILLKKTTNSQCNFDTFSSLFDHTFDTILCIFILKTVQKKRNTDKITTTVFV